jgi:TFIIF-interacting CTD phosphatase-like protein
MKNILEQHSLPLLSLLKYKMPTAIILDIDETLCSTFEDILYYHKLKPYEVLELRSRLYVIDVTAETGYQYIWGVKRPYVDEFIRFCFKNADYVIVWSAGVEDYVKQMIKILFTSAGHPEPHFYFHRDHCFNNEGDLIKPLFHLHEFEEMLKDVSLPEMIILDNKESNFDFNVENGLLIDDYIPKTIEEMLEDDRSLLYAIDSIEVRLMRIKLSGIKI